MASSGGMQPGDAAEETLETGLHHLSERAELCFLKNVYGGLLLSGGCLLALVLATGFPSITDSDPGMMRLLQGAAFPIGLIIVYSLGGELFTGYGMWFAMTALSRQGRIYQYVRAPAMSILGNYIGCFFFAGCLSYLTETLTVEPWRSRVIEQIDSDITDQQWHVIFLRAIGCGFLVTTAMIFGTQNRDGISKALGLHLPFFISTACKFPHSTEYMYLGTVGMMLGARLTVKMFLWKCMLPVMLGNTLGGMFTGAYNWYVFIKREDGKNQSAHDGQWLPSSNEE